MCAIPTSKRLEGALFFKRLTDSGYTFLEATLHLLITMVSGYLFIIIASLYYQLVDLKDASQEIEWNLFILEANQYFNRVHSIYLDDLKQIVYFRDPKFNHVEYEFRIANNRIARRSHYSTTNQTLLTDFVYGNAYLDGNLLRFEIMFNGGKYRKRVFSIVSAYQ